MDVTLKMVRVLWFMQKDISLGFRIRFHYFLDFLHANNSNMWGGGGKYIRSSCDEKRVERTH